MTNSEGLNVKKLQEALKILNENREQLPDTFELRGSDNFCKEKWDELMTFNGEYEKI